MSTKTLKTQIKELIKDDFVMCKSGEYEKALEFVVSRILHAIDTRDQAAVGEDDKEWADVGAGAVHNKAAKVRNILKNEIKSRLKETLGV